MPAFDTHPSVCTHPSVKFHSDFIGARIKTRVHCNDCGVTVVVSIPAKSVTGRGVPALQLIEHMARRVLVSAIKNALAQGQKVATSHDG